VLGRVRIDVHHPCPVRNEGSGAVCGREPEPEPQHDHQVGLGTVRQPVEGLQ
jgi:hypothetical protein